MISRIYIVGHIFNSNLTKDYVTNGVSEQKEWKKTLVYVEAAASYSKYPIKRRLTAWDKNAELALNCNDGDIVSITAHIQTKKNQDGVYADIWVIDNFEILTSNESIIHTQKPTPNIKKNNESIVTLNENDGILWD